MVHHQKIGVNQSVISEVFTKVFSLVKVVLYYNSKKYCMVSLVFLDLNCKARKGTKAPIGSLIGA